MAIVNNNNQRSGTVRWIFYLRLRLCGITKYDYDLRVIETPKLFFSHLVNWHFTVLLFIILAVVCHYLMASCQNVKIEQN